MPDVVFDVVHEGATVDVLVGNPVVDVGVSEQILSVVTVEGPPGPQGLPGEGVPVVGEHLAGADGSRTVFTTASPYRAATIAVYLNGLRETHFAESSATTITLQDAPSASDDVRVDYIIQ